MKVKDFYKALLNKKKDKGVPAEEKAPEVKEGEEKPADDKLEDNKPSEENKEKPQAEAKDAKDE